MSLPGVAFVSEKELIYIQLIKWHLFLSVYSSQTQVIIEHSYLGPLCLQFTNSPSVVDVKCEIMERTGLPIKDQDVYHNGKKARQIEKLIICIYCLILSTEIDMKKFPVKM